MTKKYWSTSLTGTITKFLILSVLFSGVAVAENAAIGGAFLASGHVKFPCKRILPLHKASPVAYHATMWQTFGISNTSAGNRCWRKIIETMGEKPLVLEFYISNEVCRRKGNCYSQELNHRLSVSQYNKKLCDGHRRTVRKVKRRMTEIKSFCGRYGKETTHCLLAIGLESQYSECAAKKLVSLAKGTGWGDHQIIHNPVGGAPYLKTAGAHYVEHHNTGLHFPASLPTNRRIATLDGIDPDFCHDKQGREGIDNRMGETALQGWTDVNKTRTAYLGYWCSVHQGITGSTTSSPDPRKRSPYVAKSDITKFIKLAKFDSGDPVTPPPSYNTKRCTKVMSGKDGAGGFLWKHSEHGGLVVLFPGSYKVKFKRVVILKPTGAREKLGFSGWANADHNGERQHWRHSKNPDQFPDRSVVRATFQTSIFSTRQYHCWKIDDASERND